ncbi:MAG: hypothetical protein LBI64_05935 [Coriobacteriales bacterium]|jgi:hypothetical protein|nr:hypothetical protein [Coriobacteriales bacterium]
MTKDNLSTVRSDYQDDSLAPVRLERRVFSLVLVCILLSVVVLCPLYASFRTMQGCEAGGAVDTALMVCAVSAAVLTETLILVALPLFAQRMSLAFQSLSPLLYSFRLDYDPPPGRVKTNFLTPLRI